MKVTLSTIEKKRVYEYLEITVDGIEPNWYINREWNSGPDVYVSNGKLVVTLKRKKNLDG